MDYKISIVLPIYNVEQYLDRCILSVVNQTYNNLEIILVDDGSPDNCSRICDNWADKDNRIRVLHKQNEGLGMARNSGLDVATGEYICFFDSDDYIDSNAIKSLVEVVEKNNADVVTFGFKEIDNKGRIRATHVPLTEKLYYSGADVVKSFLPELIGANPCTGVATNLHMSAWASMFSVRLLRSCNFRFASERDIIAEDVYSLLGLYRYVQSVAVLGRDLYCYCENKFSLTHTYRTDRFERIKEFSIKADLLADQFENAQELKVRLLEPFFSFTIATLKMILAAENIRSKQAFYDVILDTFLLSKVEKLKTHSLPTHKKILLFSLKYKLTWLTWNLLKIKKLIAKWK